MPSGVYERKKKIKRTKHKPENFHCDYCGETLNMSPVGFKNHVSSHIRNGDQKTNSSPETALVVHQDLSCPECKSEGKLYIAKTKGGLAVHRSTMHNVRGSFYLMHKKLRLKKRKQGDHSNGNTSINHSREEATGFTQVLDAERLDYFAAGYTTRTIEVLAASTNRSPSILTERILTILTMGGHPVRAELRSKDQVLSVRR